MWRAAKPRRGLTSTGYGRAAGSASSGSQVGGEGSPARSSIRWHSHLSWQPSATSGLGRNTRAPASSIAGAARASSTGSRSVSGSTARTPSRRHASATAAP